MDEAEDMVAAAISDRQEALEEVERLRAALKAIVAYDWFGATEAGMIAREALEGPT